MKKTVLLLASSALLSIAAFAGVNSGQTCIYILSDDAINTLKPAPECSMMNSGDHDKGHGNDEDCFDEDNKGNSKGCKR